MNSDVDPWPNTSKGDTRFWRLSDQQAVQYHLRLSDYHWRRSQVSRDRTENRTAVSLWLAYPLIAAVVITLAVAAGTWLA